MSSSNNCKAKIIKYFDTNISINYYSFSVLKNDKETEPSASAWFKDYNFNCNPHVASAYNALERFATICCPLVGNNKNIFCNLH